MRTTSRTMLVAVAVLCSLAITAAGASANRAIRLEPAGPITKVSEEFTITAFGGEIRITCRLTLAGILEPVIQKVRALPEGRVGQITAGIAEGCRNNLGGGAVVTFLVEANRPVNLRFEAFLGNLPNITGILFRKLALPFQVIEAFQGACLYQGGVGLLITFPPVEEGGGRRFNQERFNMVNMIPLAAGGGECSPSVTLSGRAKITPPQRAVLQAD
jgi:hypothetical protein